MEGSYLIMQSLAHEKCRNRSSKKDYATPVNKANKDVNLEVDKILQDELLYENPDNMIIKSSGQWMDNKTKTATKVFTSYSKPPASKHTDTTCRDDVTRGQL